jgi:hypothetical protein
MDAIAAAGRKACRGASREADRLPARRREAGPERNGETGRDAGPARQHRRDETYEGGARERGRRCGDAGRTERANEAKKTGPE